MDFSTSSPARVPGTMVQPLVIQSLFPSGRADNPRPGRSEAGRRIRGMARIPQPILDAARPASGHPRRQLIPILGATALTLPAILTRLSGAAPPEWLAAVVFGLGVVGAAFLLAWGAEALQLDISQGLALAVLALIAVLPEYAVDFTFALKAGQDPAKYAPLALANMTGGNRLLIGVGWSLVVLLAAWRI